MKSILKIFFTILLLCVVLETSGVISGKTNCNNVVSSGKAVKIIFLHHSTGECIWNGGVSEWFKKYNANHGTNYQIVEQIFFERIALRLAKLSL